MCFVASPPPEPKNLAVGRLFVFSGPLSASLAILPLSLVSSSLTNRPSESTSCSAFLRPSCAEASAWRMVARRASSEVSADARCEPSSRRRVASSCWNSSRCLSASAAGGGLCSSGCGGGASASSAGRRFRSLWKPSSRAASSLTAWTRFSRSSMMQLMSRLSVALMTAIFLLSGAPSAAKPPAVLFIGVVGRSAGSASAWPPAA
mmetsp:Transcript_66677/g.214803  ORF Transcript_66677/g.214803 Transcript_66677/m.214803 type:complete len:205 (-) Transcript_66677:112-726(-)